MKTTLHLSPDKPIQQIQDEFNNRYRFLKIDFYQKQHNPRLVARKKLIHSMPLKAAGLTIPGDLQVENEMTVGELERKFLSAFGLEVQLSRKSGNIWLETTMTDTWTLARQNSHGQEISNGIENNTASYDDYDLEKGLID